MQCSVIIYHRRVLHICIHINTETKSYSANVNINAQVIQILPIFLRNPGDKCITYPRGKIYVGTLSLCPHGSVVTVDHSYRQDTTRSLLTMTWSNVTFNEILLHFVTTILKELFYGFASKYVKNSAIILLIKNFLLLSLSGPKFGLFFI